jgi:phosphotriesterase-related protein
MAKYIHTVTGPVTGDELGLILPHEHLFVDLRGPTVPGYAHADPESVVQVMKSYLDEAYAAGVTALGECSTLGVGRNLAVLQRLAEITPIRIIAPTGVYREAFTPPALLDLSDGALAADWMRELTEGIEGSKVRAGFIKIAMSDNGPMDIEIRNLKAAARASIATGAAIASHTVNGAVVRIELRVLETAGLDLGRFIWVHADAEPDTAIHLEVAKRGAYIEFDAIGARKDYSAQADYTVALIEAGYTERILLSHDAGWYDPAQPNGQPPGAGVRGFTALVKDFFPFLRQRGITEDIIRLITVTNPARAFAF